MLRNFLVFILSASVLLSCKKEKSTIKTEEVTQTVSSSIIKSDQPIVPLNAKADSLVSSWPEYKKFKDLISGYQEISMTEALLNSVELSELALQLKDSVRVEKLNIPEVKIRLNVLYSETLRLADMSTIPTITEDLVAEENNNIINAYSALNLKINNMNLQEEINEELSEFIDEVVEEREKDSLNSEEEDEDKDKDEGEVKEK
ncbi:hypothetical protein [Lutimonas zeaxanthinifaciens]|uniref:hypothetical protein n=1 Tax=Lutimonas zeaxanthinifaciens TaxID=3060215 RepID=UPI00265D133D|nr:hypothetical protein [Lutimonas sp. YSD2104]WKK66590.1 hypothetical protein QZH61_02990 [Lutimonas sp. YSD2104]